MSRSSKSVAAWSMAFSSPELGIRDDDRWWFDGWWSGGGADWNGMKSLSFPTSKEDVRLWDWCLESAVLALDNVSSCMRAPVDKIKSLLFILWATWLWYELILCSLAGSHNIKKFLSSLNFWTCSVRINWSFVFLCRCLDITHSLNEHGVGRLWMAFFF